MSSIRDIALAKAIGGGAGPSVTVEPLSVNENGVHTAPAGTAYNPVSVDVQPVLEALSVTDSALSLLSVIYLCFKETAAGFYINIKS